MDKISQIVPSGARMASAEAQTSRARAAAGLDPRPSTADRAAATATDLAQRRQSTGETQIIDQLARDFFLTDGPAGPGVGPAPDGFVPRGTYVDVQA